MCIFWNFITVASLTVCEVGEWSAAWRADRFLFFTFRPDSAITSNEVKSPVATTAETETKTEIKEKTKGRDSGASGKKVGKYSN